MNTGLGLNFLRIVNEEGINGWSQVYARVPFDDVELRSKGALFGAVFGPEVESWADLEVEMTTWIDEYFNGANSDGDLSHFFFEWKKKYEGLSAVWLWVRLSGNSREIKIVKWGKSGAFLKRGDNTTDLMGGVETGRVIKGVVKPSEVLYLWTDGLGEKITAKSDCLDEEKKALDLGKELVEENYSASGLVLRIEKMDSGEIGDDGTILEMSTHRQVPESRAEPVKEQSIEIEKKEIVVELVGNRYVGPIGIKEKILNLWNSRQLYQRRGLTVGQNTSKRKNVASMLGVIFLLLLLASLVTGSIKMKGDAEEKKWRNFYEPIEKSRQEALNLAQINPVGARKMMEEVMSTFEIRKVEFLDTKRRAEVSGLEKRISDGWVVTSGEKSVEIEDIARIDLVRPGFVGDRMTITPDARLLVSDNNMGVAVSIQVLTRDIRVVAGKVGTESWIDLTGEDKKPLIASKTGIKNAESGLEVIAFDAAVIDPVSVGMFMNNIYVLDRANKEIFKYSASGESFGVRTRWLLQGQVLGIVPIDMAIDADIWVVEESGQIEKYRRGAKEQFFVSGLPGGLKVSKMALEVEGGRIALLDSTAGIVLICNKDNGNCSQQLKSERLKMAKDLEFGTDGSLFVLFPGVLGRLK